MSTEAMLLSQDERKRSGSHYTPNGLARFVSKQILKYSEAIRAVRVLDPAIGDGELLCSLLDDLCARGIKITEAVGYETNSLALKTAGLRLDRGFPGIRFRRHEADFLRIALDDFVPSDSLFARETSETFDLIIANPPYVRTQVLGAEQAQVLARQFGLAGRVDLYHAFIEAMGRVLSPGGIAGIIVSNRFMTTKAGVSIRAGILRQFDILHVFDLGDTKLFEAAVLPAVLILALRKNSCEGPF